jgi:phospholipid transport system substrate-binding protein
MLRTLILILVTGASSDQSATDVLKARAEEIRKSIGDGATVSSHLQAAVMAIVDTEAMAKAALGKAWDGQPKSEQRRFLKAFDGRLRRAMTQQVDFFNSSKIDYLPEKQDGDGVLVQTEMTTKGDTTEVIYRLRKGSAGWHIVDIIIDGISTTENYRSSFGKVLAKDGWKGLVERLEKTPANAQ